jgi:hypothetical protein
LRLIKTYHHPTVIGFEGKDVLRAEKEKRKEKAVVGPRGRIDRREAR